MVKKLERKYVTTKNIKGRQYHYFRRGEIYQRLPDDPDTQEFDDVYWAIRSGRSKKTIATTFETLIVSYYKTPEFKKKSLAYSKTIRALLKSSERRTAPRILQNCDAAM